MNLKTSSFIEGKLLQKRSFSNLSVSIMKTSPKCANRFTKPFKKGVSEKR